MASDIGDIDRGPWSVADQPRGNSGLKPSEYSRPVLGLLFLRYADGRFLEAETQLQPAPLRPRGRAGTGRIHGAGRAGSVYRNGFSGLI